MYHNLDDQHGNRPIEDVNVINNPYGFEENYVNQPFINGNGYSAQ